MSQDRAYQHSHPWLRFTIDLSVFDYQLWLLLGEARSKCEHLARVPMKSSLARQLHNVYLAKGVQATTAIEGNTLSLEEVQRRIDNRLELPKSRQYLGQEVDNILTAVNRIAPLVVAEAKSELRVDELLEFNRLVLDGLELDPGVVPGEIRRHEVGVGSYSGAPAQDCSFLLDRLCSWLNDPGLRPQDDRLIPFSIVRAVLAHLYLAWIHPFGDGNGRTARLVEFKLLVAAGVPTPAAHLLSNHYNATRSEYYRQLSRASASGGDVLPFIRYAVQGFVDGLREQLDPVWNQQWDLAWRDFIHEELMGDGKTQRRMRHLVMDIANLDEPIALDGIRTVTPRIAADYAGLSQKTLMRDVRELTDKQLIVRSPKGYAANRKLILGFLPLSRIPTTSSAV